MPDHEPGCYADHVGTGESELFARGQRSDGTLLVGPGVAVYVGERPPLRSLGRVVAWAAEANAGREDPVGPRVLVGGEALDARDRTGAADRIVFVDERTAAGRLLGLTRGRAPWVRAPKDTSLDLREERRMVARLFGALGFDADGIASDDFAELVAPLEKRALASSDARRGGNAALSSRGKLDPLPGALHRMGLSLSIASEWYRVAGPLVASCAGIADEELRRHFSPSAWLRSTHFCSRLGLGESPPAHVGFLFGGENEAIPVGSTRIAVTDWRDRSGVERVDRSAVSAEPAGDGPARSRGRASGRKQ